MGSLVAATTRKFDSYESIVKLTVAEMQQALAERGVMVAKRDKTTLTSLLLKSVCGEFRLVDDRVSTQQVQTELLGEVANQLAEVKEYLGSLKDAPPSPQQPQLEEELQQLKGLREELKGSHEGFKTVERKLSHQADATQRQKHVFNAVLRNFAGKEGVSVATPLWPSVGVKPNTWKSWGFGVLRDSRMFRARQKGPKHLALGCSWCHWKGLET
jgi:hypothetical protein